MTTTTAAHSGHLHRVGGKQQLADHLHTWHRGTDGTLRRAAQASSAWTLPELQRSHAELHGTGRE